MLDPAHDPHAAIIFPSLPAGNLVERNPLPYHEPPYVPKPFLGRSIELQRLVLMLGRKRNKEVRMRVVAPTLAPALSPNGNPNPNPNGNPNPNPSGTRWLSSQCQQKLEKTIPQYTHGTVTP